MKASADGFLFERFGFEREVELKQAAAKISEEVREAKQGSKSNFGTGFG